MTSRRNDDELEAKLRGDLEEITRDLPPGVSARLAAARRNALARMSPSGTRIGMPALAASAAALGVVVVLVWRLAAPPPEPDILELAVREELELVDDLDFYLWLDQMAREG